MDTTALKNFAQNARRQLREQVAEFRVRCLKSQISYVNFLRHFVFHLSCWELRELCQKRGPEKNQLSKQRKGMFRTEFATFCCVFKHTR